MKLRVKTLRIMAGYICGGETDPFPYRTQRQLEDFFEDCEVEAIGDGGSRASWTYSVLLGLASGVSTLHGLPSDDLVRVFQELMNPGNFPAQVAPAFSKGWGTQRVPLPVETELPVDKAFRLANEALLADDLKVFLDENRKPQIKRITGRDDSAHSTPKERKWTIEEQQRADCLVSFLDAASEDEFTVQLLVPLLSCLGFQRITVAGHRDKGLEYGVDLWWKFKLPTRHSIYFGAQVKVGTIDSAGRTVAPRQNIAEVHNQIQMMLGRSVLDPEVNREVLFDHVFLISAGAITKQARHWLVAQLDESKRRHIIFMDRDEIVLLAVANNVMPQMIRG